VAKFKEHEDGDENGDGWMSDPEPDAGDVDDGVQYVTAERSPIEHPTPTELKHVQFDKALDEPRPGHVPWGLTMRQWQFIQEYLVDFNAAKAARRAGYKSGDYGTAYRLLKHPVVRRALEDILDERAGMYAADHARIIQELCAIGYFDIGDIIAWGGERSVLRFSEQLKSGTRRCVKSVTATTSPNGAKKIHVETHSKIDALRLLAQATGLVRDPRMSDRAISQANKAVASELDSVAGKLVDATIELCAEYITDPKRADEFVTALVQRFELLKREYESSMQGEIDVVVPTEQLPEPKHPQPEPEQKPESDEE